MADIYEIVVFKFKEGVAPKEQKNLMAKINAFVTNLKGFEKREYFYCEHDNRWVDLVTWTDLASAKNAADEFFRSPACSDIISKIDDTSIVTSHYEKMDTQIKQ